MTTSLGTNSGNEQEQVASLLIPMQSKSLLVPNVVVAEVVALVTLEKTSGSSPWVLGNFIWRGQQVPVLSFEIANSQVHGQDSTSARLAVFNTTTGQSALEFFALLVQGIPRILKLSAAEIREDEQAPVGEAEQMAVITQLGKAVIPNLNHLEGLLNRLS